MPARELGVSGKGAACLVADSEPLLTHFAFPVSIGSTCGRPTRGVAVLDGAAAAACDQEAGTPRTGLVMAFKLLDMAEKP